MSLTRVDCLFKDFKSTLLQTKSLIQQIYREEDNREDAVKTMYGFFKKIAEVSDANLISNVDYLVTKSPKLNHSELKWIGANQKRFDNNRFQLDY